jgi:hypothetical protein
MELAAELSKHAPGSTVKLGYMFHTSALGYYPKETSIVLIGHHSAQTMPPAEVKESSAQTMPPAEAKESSAQTMPPAEVNQETSKPLAGYTEIMVEPFTVENGHLTKDFPAGEEGNLQLSAIAALRASGIFEKVDDGSQPSSERPVAKEGQRKVILSGTVIAFRPGSSGARYLTWPLPVGVTKARARFVLRDAASNQEVFRFEKEARFQAAGTFGIATKEGQMSHMKGGLVDALVKEIKHNR